MVTSIARQSIIIKCEQQASILLGNYEFYYLAGLMKKLYQLDIHEDMEPSVLYEAILPHLETLKPEDKKEAHLIKLATNFKPLEEYDEQMKELFRWGATEENLWQVHI